MAIELTKEDWMAAKIQAEDAVKRGMIIVKTNNILLETAEAELAKFTEAAK